MLAEERRQITGGHQRLKTAVVCAVEGHSKRLGAGRAHGQDPVTQRGVRANGRRRGNRDRKMADRRARVASSLGRPSEHRCHRQYAYHPPLIVHDGERLGPRGEQTRGHIGERVLQSAGNQGSLSNEIVQKRMLQAAMAVGRLMVGSRSAFGLDVLDCLWKLEYAGLEIVSRKGVQDEVAFRSRGVKTGPGARVALDAQHVTGPSNVTQLGAAARFVPGRDRPLLDHEHLRAVRLALPQDVFVPFVKPHATARGQGQQIAQLGDPKGRVLLQKIGDAVADFRGIHSRRLSGRPRFPPLPPRGAGSPARSRP